MSALAQKLGGKFIIDGAQSSQSRQDVLDWQLSHRFRAATYRTLNRGTAPPPGSIPRRAIIS
jgi:hypothetical protein